ncbi:30S ribosomal protein S18 [Streptomyces sp. NPDC001312]|uniref:30S ribosomal protein S18 n=1 Tax=Streptomyces sp. NPDC001312 TaxID=3364561 RepID=UPI0036A81F4E
MPEDHHARAGGAVARPAVGSARQEPRLAVGRPDGSAPPADRVYVSVPRPPSQVTRSVVLLTESTVPVGIDRGKIRSRRVTRVTAQQQRLLARAIKNAREMALLPYSAR